MDTILKKARMELEEAELRWDDMLGELKDSDLAPEEIGEGVVWWRSKRVSLRYLKGCEWTIADSHGERVKRGGEVVKWLKYALQEDVAAEFVREHKEAMQVANQEWRYFFDLAHENGLAFSRVAAHPCNFKTPLTVEVCREDLTMWVSCPNGEFKVSFKCDTHLFRNAKDAMEWILGAFNGQS